MKEQDQHKHAVEPIKLHNDSQNTQDKGDRNENNNNCETSHLWSMSFYGSCNRTGAREGVWIHNIDNNHGESHSYKLNFQCTNNIEEYEALLLGLHLLKKLGARRIAVNGDSELIIRQINGDYTAKYPRLRTYRDYSMDLLKSFEEYELFFFPRDQNILANDLAYASSSCQRPYEDKQFIVQVKYRPVVPDNEKCWQVFEGDK